MAPARKLTDNYIATLVDEEIVLIDMMGGELFSLKDTARTIWEMIDGKRSRSDIIAALKRRYDVDDATARADLAALLDDLAAAKLVEERA